MVITVDYTNCLADAVGAEHGLTADELAAYDARAKGVIEALRARRESGELGFFDLPFAEEALRAIVKFAHDRKGRYDNIVVLGIGGSALAPLFMQRALNHGEWNLLGPQARMGDPRLFVVDNSDPELLAGVLDVLVLDRTLFLAVSKSGGTAETVAALHVAFDLVATQLGKDKLKDHITLITDPKKGYFRRLADELKLPSLEVPSNVGGRFCALTAVGLLPLALCGIDPLEITAGAAEMVTSAMQFGDLDANWPYRVAAIHHALDTTKGKTVSVMMPYAQGLKEFGDWYAQLWAESLGKTQRRDGRSEPCGQTTLRALGATDQHSQLQLFLEGPNDKVTTFVEAKALRRDLPIPPSPIAEPALDYLKDKSFAQLISAELYGTRGALTQQQRPNLTVTLDGITPRNIGALMMAYEIATAVSGELYDINAFDQPGVELGKVITRERLAQA